jgi:hypothetical protein
MSIATMLTAAALWLPATAAPLPDQFTLSDGSVIVGTLKTFACKLGEVTGFSVVPSLFGEGAPIVVPIEKVTTVTLQGVMTLAREGSVRDPLPTEQAAVSAYPRSHLLSEPAPDTSRRIDLVKATDGACTILDDQTTWTFVGKAGASPSISTQSQNTANAGGTLFAAWHPATAGFRDQTMRLELAGSYGTSKKAGGPTTKQVEWFTESLQYTFNVDDKVTTSKPPMIFVYALASNYHNYSLGVSSERSAAVGVSRIVDRAGRFAVAADVRVLQKNFFDYAPSFTSLAARLRESVFLSRGPVSVNETIEFYPTFKSMDGREARAGLGFGWALTPTVSFDISTTIDYVHDAPAEHKTLYLKPTATFTFKLGNR